MDKWVLPNLKAFAKNCKHSDCCFVIKDTRGTKIFLCHKLVLSLASEVFENMLYDGVYKEAKTGQVFLDNVDIDIFDKLRRYIYGYGRNKLEVYNTKTLRKLLMVGNKYLIQSKTTECVQILSNRAESMDIPGLLDLCECGYYTANCSLILTVSTIMQNKSIKSLYIHNGLFDLPPQVFYQYMIMTKETLAEPIRFNIIELYFKMFCPSNVIIYSTRLSQELHDRDMLAVQLTVPDHNEQLQENFWPIFAQSVVDLIDFKKFTPKQFYDGPGKSFHLTLELKFDLLYQIAKTLEA